MTIECLFISPGHNYFEHHGIPAGDHPLLDVTTINCVAGRGIVGDRFFDQRPDYKGQITFFAVEVFDQLCRDLKLEEVHPGSLRRNVITRGIDLNALIGEEFSIQGVQFLGTEECRPCYWMNNSLRNPVAEAWLKGRGGLRAKIVSDGALHRGE